MGLALGDLVFWPFLFLDVQDNRKLAQGGVAKQEGSFVPGRRPSAVASAPFSCARMSKAALENAHWRHGITRMCLVDWRDLGIAHGVDLSGHHLVDLPTHPLGADTANC